MKPLDPVGLAIEAVLFDRDGTLIEDIPYSSNVTKVVPRVGAVRAVAALRGRNLKTGVVTNQSGIGKGLLTAANVTAMNHRVDQLFGTFDVWAVCPHVPTDRCECRKPAPGLVIDASTRLGVRPQQVVVVGDRLADLGAARAAGCIAMLIPSERTEPRAEQEADSVLSTMKDLPLMVDWLNGGQG